MMLFARMRVAGTILMCVALATLGIRAAAEADNPVIVVFPFQPNGTVPAKLGEQVAAIIAQHIGESGDITVMQPPATATPATFQHDAQTLGAQYYVTGYVTPIGSQVSLLEYVVSVRTGTITYSNTATAADVSDVQSQAYQLRKAIMAIASPAQTAQHSAAPAATPSPTPTPAPPQATGPNGGTHWVVVQAAGGLNAAERAQAQQALVAALKAKGVDAVADADSAPQGPSLTKVLCAQNAGARLVTATVDNVRTARDFDGSIEAVLLSCTNGAPLRSVRGNGHSIEQAAQAAASALLAPAPQRRRHLL